MTILTSMSVLREYRAWHPMQLHKSNGNRIKGSIGHVPRGVWVHASRPPSRSTDYSVLLSEPTWWYAARSENGCTLQSYYAPHARYIITKDRNPSIPLLLMARLTITTPDVSMPYSGVGRDGVLHQ
jgi:hypothetical protein